MKKIIKRYPMTDRLIVRGGYVISLLEVVNKSRRRIPFKRPIRYEPTQSLGKALEN